MLCQLFPPSLSRSGPSPGASSRRAVVTAKYRIDIYASCYHLSEQSTAEEGEHVIINSALTNDLQVNAGVAHDWLWNSIS
jgi:hypothetical protein